MCNETGIPEFLESQILGIPMVAIVTSRIRSLRNPTQQILKNPPEYTMQNRVQSGRNTKNNMHAHLLGIA